MIKINLTAFAFALGQVIGALSGDEFKRFLHTKGVTTDNITMALDSLRSIASIFYQDEKKDE